MAVGTMMWSLNVKMTPTFIYVFFTFISVAASNHVGQDKNTQQPVGVDDEFYFLVEVVLSFLHPLV